MGFGECRIQKSLENIFSSVAVFSVAGISTDGTLLWQEASLPTLKVSYHYVKSKENPEVAKGNSRIHWELYGFPQE